MKIVPYDLFVKFLVTKGFLKIHEINDELAKYHLGAINQEILNRHVLSVKAPLPSPIYKQIETGKQGGMSFLKWMDRIDLESIWLNEKPYRTDKDASLWKLVYYIRTDPMVRNAVNSMLLKEHRLDELAKALNAKYATFYNKNHLEVYRKYFWNPALMTRADWRDYLASCDTYEREVLFTALTETIDILKTKLGLPASLQISESIQFMATEAMQKVKHFVRLGDSKANAEARYWMSRAEDLLVKYDKFKSADLRDFSKELQMQFEYVETSYDTPDDTLRAEVEAKGLKEKDNTDDDSDAEQTELPIK